MVGMLALALACPPSMERLGKEILPRKFDSVLVVRERILKKPPAERRAFVEGHLRSPLRLLRRAVDSLAVTVGILEYLTDMSVEVDTTPRIAHVRDNRIVVSPLVGKVNATDVAVHEGIHYIMGAWNRKFDEAPTALSVCYSGVGVGYLYELYRKGGAYPESVFFVLLSPFVKSLAWKRGLLGTVKGDNLIKAFYLKPFPKDKGEHLAEEIMGRIAPPELWVEYGMVMRMLSWVFENAQDKNMALLLTWWNAKKLAEELNIPYNIPKP